MLAHKKGIAFALITSVISGVSIFLNKYAVDTVKPPLYFTSIKNLSVGFMLVCLLLVTRKWNLLRKISKKDWLRLALVGLIGGSLPFYLFFTGLSQVPAINGTLIHKTLVFWVALLAVPLLKERLTKIQIVAICLMFVGNLTIGGFKGFTRSNGEIMILVATLLWAVENIIAKKLLNRIDSSIIALFRMGFGSLILFTATVIKMPERLMSAGSLQPNQLFWIGLTAILLLGYVLSWYKALSLAPATTVTTVLVSSTLVTNVLSALFVTHTWNLELSLRSLAIVAGTILVIVPTKRLKQLAEVF